MNEDILAKAFQPFPSYTKCRIIQVRSSPLLRLFSAAPFIGHCERCEHRSGFAAAGVPQRRYHNVVNSKRRAQDYKKCKTKAYGFVSFTDHGEGAKALKAMNGKYIGNRPCQLKKSTHTVRNAPGDNKKRRAMLANPLERVTTKRMR